MKSNFPFHQPGYTGAFRPAKRRMLMSVNRQALACCLLLAVSLGLVQCTRQSEPVEKVVNVFSQRQTFLIEPLLTAFTKKTGIAVKVVYAKKGLIQRLQQEGKGTEADVLLTTDVRPLQEAAKRGLLQAVSDPTLDKIVPPALRHPDNLWWGVSLRARVIYASTARTKPGDITTYEQLADPKWKGKVCTRSLHHPYNVSLVASLIGHLGQAKTKQWLQGVEKNLAQKPQGNDRAQMRTIHAGLCDVALANSYYMGKMLENPDQKAWADAVYLVFPNQQGRGTHVNISGAAVLKHAKHTEHAIALLKFLLSPEGQTLYAEKNYEHPVAPNVPWPALLKEWGRFKADELPLKRLVEQIPTAVQLIDEVGLN